jgi:hypothetical protein
VGVVAALVATTVALVALRNGSSAATSAAVVYTGQAAATPGPSLEPTTKLAGGYRLTSVTGQTIVFPDRRPTLLYFMSASCLSCWQGNSQIAQIYPKLRKDAEVVSLDVTPQVDTVADVEQMMQETGAQWPQAFATPSILNRYHIEYLDTAVVLSPTGKVVYDGPIPSNGQILALLHKAAAVPPAVTSQALGVRPKPVSLHVVRAAGTVKRGTGQESPSPCC